MRIKWGNLIKLLLFAAIIGTVVYSVTNPVSLRGWLDRAMGLLGRDGAARETGQPTAGRQPEAGTPGSTASPGAAAPAFDPLTTVRLAYDSWAPTGLIHLIPSRGIDARNGYTLQAAYEGADRERARKLLAGELDVTSMGLPSFVALQEELPGFGVIIGYQDQSRGADVLIAKPHVRTLNDLAGRKIGYSADGFVGIFQMDYYLQLVGLTHGDVVAKPYQSMMDDPECNCQSAADAFRKGEIDALVSWQPDASQILGESPGAHILISTREFRNLISDYWVAAPEFVRERPELVEKFLTSYYETVNFYRANPDFAYQKLREVLPADDYPWYTDPAIPDAEGEAAIKEDIEGAYLANVTDNLTLFGLAGQADQFGSLFKQVNTTFLGTRRMKQTLVPAPLVNTSFLPRVAAALPQVSSDVAVDRRAEQPVDLPKLEAPGVAAAQAVAKIKVDVIYFETGSSRIKPESYPVLDAVAETMRNFPTYYLIVDGHTDSVGSREFNLRLSEDRAKSVIEYLANQGLPTNQFVGRGFGPDNPIADNNTEAGRAQNRRTDFRLVQVVQP